MYAYRITEHVILDSVHRLEILNHRVSLTRSRHTQPHIYSLVRMKALLFVLVRAFEFELAVPADTLWSKQTVVQRPIVSTDLDAGHQLPLRIRIYQK